MDLRHPNFIQRPLRTTYDDHGNLRLMEVMPRVVYLVAHDSEGTPEPGIVLTRSLEKSSLHLGGAEPEADEDEFFDRHVYGVHECRRSQRRAAARASAFEVKTLEGVGESTLHIAHLSLVTVPTEQTEGEAARTASSAASRLGQRSRLRNEHKRNAQRQLMSASAIRGQLETLNARGELVFKSESVLAELKKRKEQVTNVSIFMFPRVAFLARLEDEVVDLVEDVGQKAKKIAGKFSSGPDNADTVALSAMAQLLYERPVMPYVRLFNLMANALNEAGTHLARGSYTAGGLALGTVENMARLPRIRRKLANVLDTVALAYRCNVAVDYDELEDEIGAIRHGFNGEILKFANLPLIARAVTPLADAHAAAQARDLRSCYTQLKLAGDQLDGITRPKRR
ncbi:MAG: hypothetical protein NUV56_04050 [Candidatus Uhrbacteria bacterium]|nr:hypothetical protein [Candidatus Uhrbacteria bacterium]